MVTKRLTIETQEQLQRAYMPFIKQGGLFFVTEERYQLQDKLSLIVRLPGDNQDTLVAATVVWLAPVTSVTSNQGGIGIQFRDDKSHLRDRIESKLGNLVNSPIATATM